VFAVLYMIVGGILFGMVYFSILTANVVRAQSHLSMTPIYIATSNMFATLCTDSLLEVACLLLWIASCVILFEYALSFTTVCYYYDSKSRAIPKLWNSASDAINGHFRLQRDDAEKLDRKRRIYLENEILKIRNNTPTEPKIE
jgi:hypothetical protein